MRNNGCDTTSIAHVALWRVLLPLRNIESERLCSGRNTEEYRSHIYSFNMTFIHHSSSRMAPLEATVIDVIEVFFFYDTHTGNMWLGNPAISPALAYLIIGFKCCNSSMEFLCIWSYILFIKNPWIHGIKKCIRANHNWGTQTALFWGFRHRTKGAQIDLLWSVCVSAETNHHKLHTAK